MDLEKLVGFDADINWGGDKVIKKHMRKVEIKNSYSSLFLKKLKQNIKLEEVIRQDFEIKKLGKNFFMKCLFCKSKKSLAISSEKQFGHCFCCNESFDVFGYFQKVKGLSFSRAVIEVKKFINLNNDIELRKLLKASLYSLELKQGQNPISGQPIISQPFKEEQTIEVVEKIDWILTFLISDYARLDQEKKLLPEELSDCEMVTRRILAYGFIEEDIGSRERLKNLFDYILGILNLIEDNDCNLSGIVYGLK